MPVPVRWIVSTVLSVFAAYVTWLLSTLAGTGLLAVLGLDTSVSRVALEVVPHAAAGVAFVGAGAAVAQKTRWTPLLQVVLLVAVLVLLMLAEVLAIPTGRQVLGAGALVAGAGLTAGWLLARDRRRPALPD